MPDKKERDMWRAFLAGMPESDWNPPKKPKKQKFNAKSQIYNSGLRAWPEIFSQGPPQESWPNNDEGEVEHVLRVDPAESLPSPVGTPLSSDSFESVGQLPSNSYHTPIESALKPREPTTRILKLIDEVRSFYSMGDYMIIELMIFLLANGLASTLILHVLDQPLSSGFRFLSFSNRVTCQMDFFSVISN